jgi:hypothetical protein
LLDEGGGGLVQPEGGQEREHGSWSQLASR